MARKHTKNQRRLTSRGAATRARIVETAAALVYAEGAGRPNLDDVMAASGTSKSQLYHYFANKEALVREVITLQTRRVLAANGEHLDKLDSFAALRRWRDAMVALGQADGLFGGCPLGSLANELANTSGPARAALKGGFDDWAARIEAGLHAMQAEGTLKPSADPATLALALLGAIQGGLLLAKLRRAVRPFEVAFDMALEHVARHAA